MRRWPFSAELRIIRQALELMLPEERRQILLLVPPIVLVALLEVAGVASLAPFIALLAQPSMISKHRSLLWVYTTFSFTSPENLFFFVGVAILLLLLVSNTAAAGTNWAMLRFAWMENASMSTRMLRGYLLRDYPFFLERNSTDLLRKALHEVREAVIDVIGQTMTLIARLVAICFIGATLLLIDPFLACTAVPVFGGTYGLIFFASRRYASRAGTARMAAEARRYKIAGEALSGAKEIKLYRLEEVVAERFKEASIEASMNASNYFILAQIPRYALETVAFGGVLVIVLYLLKSGRHLEGVLPVIGLYAFASVRLLPALQGIFASLNSLRFNAGAVIALRQEVEDGRLTESTDKPGLEAPFESEIEFNDVSFSYVTSMRPVLEKVSFVVARGEWIGFVGPTGSGKSTLVDIMLGLLAPTVGRVTIDGLTLESDRHRAWQAQTAYVPQQIFLVDDTVEANICFGVATDQIDKTRMERAARVSQIHEFVTNEMPAGYKTVVGDRGIRLSGGQRQRIGIARALYRNPVLLVLDEATSALDSGTEGIFFEALRAEFAQCTVVSITHRLTTTRSFDRVYRLESGVLVGASRPGDIVESSTPSAASM
jgi:ABC-type multidrug transport system fused ATPase/permease subunit